MDPAAAEKNEEQLGLENLPEEEVQAAPDVTSDRVPATDTAPEGSLARAKTAPLGIQEIENLEDDAKGG
jgi:hypothetical protein